jgi:hypothetical protein
MAWYGVHVVMVVRFKEGGQVYFPAWENVYLIGAVDSDEAAEKAASIGKENEGDSNGTFHWDERPAEWVCEGVRKIIEVTSPRSSTNEPEDGTEVTYQTLEFASEDALKDYMDGVATTVKVVD